MFYNFDKIKTNEGKCTTTKNIHCNKLKVKLFEIERNCEELMLVSFWDPRYSGATCKCLKLTAIYGQQAFPDGIKNFIHLPAILSIYMKIFLAIKFEQIL